MNEKMELKDYRDKWVVIVQKEFGDGGSEEDYNDGGYIGDE